MARPNLPDDSVLTHFWHIPWPSWDTFRACPHKRDLLDGLLANDRIGFHTSRYQRNFLGCVDAALDEATVDWETCTVTYRGRPTSIDAVPMGVPVVRIRRSMSSSTARSFWSSFAENHGIPDRVSVAVGVDRLDYSKGIVGRLRALERFWEANPDWRGELTYVQNASESRSRIPAYREVQNDVAEAVDRINDRFGTDDWQPIVPVTDRLSHAELCGLYQAADVALVTPIRDGMNLVAQEYVAVQEDGDGALVLSDQAGIHDVLGSFAVSVTPFDIDGFANAIRQALTMPPEERKERMHRLRRWVTTNDLEAWVIASLGAATGKRQLGRRPSGRSTHAM